MNATSPSVFIIWDTLEAVLKSLPQKQIKMLVGVVGGGVMIMTLTGKIYH